MKTFLASWVCAGLLLAAAHAADDDYVPGPDSRPQPGVPAGELLKFTFDHSKIYPGTSRTYWIYVPAQYRPETPACLFVAQDGVVWNANVVFDNLIAKKQMPVTIGVFVQPGLVKAAAPTRRATAPTEALNTIRSEIPMSASCWRSSCPTP